MAAFIIFLCVLYLLYSLEIGFSTFDENVKIARTESNMPIGDYDYFYFPTKKGDFTLLNYIFVPSIFVYWFLKTIK